MKELEERCRRFDQMGLEANGELQRVARRFKDENEALRGLLIRLGYGGMIQSVLEGLSQDGFGAGYALSGPASQVPIHRHQGATVEEQPPPSGPQFADLQAPPGSVNPNLLDPTGLRDQGIQSQQQQHQEHKSHHPHQQQNQQQRAAGAVQQQRSQAQAHYEQQNSADGHGSITMRWPEEQQTWAQPQLPVRDGRQRSGSDRGGDDKSGLLSLKFDGQHTDQGRRPTGSGQTPGLTPGTFNNLMGMLTGQHQNAGSNVADSHDNLRQQYPQHDQQFSRQADQNIGGGGSAFIKREQNNPNVPLAHRPHQNDALLNPNPIPFALNLSNEPAPDQSWWDRNGGGMFGGDSFLDEKAQAVAQAQAQSPFDISSFLNTNATPGIGGYNSGMPTGFTPALASGYDALAEAGAELKASGSGTPSKGNGKESAHKNSAAPKANPLGPTDHMKTFLRLLERKAIAASHGSKGDGKLYQSVPWMDMGSDVASSSSAGSSDEERRRSRDEEVGLRRPSSTAEKDDIITPMAAYSRLTQHPAFMKTDARELEEMVSTIHHTSIATVHSQGSASGAPVELKAATLHEMLKLLDRKHSVAVGHPFGGYGGDHAGLAAGL